MAVMFLAALLLGVFLVSCSHKAGYTVKERRLGQWDDKWSAGHITPDGLHLVCLRQAGGKKCVVVDCQLGKEYDWIEDPTLSPDGKHVAYYARRGDKEVVVVDGKESPEYAGTGKHPITFSPDSKRVAYAAKNADKWFVVADGKEGAKYDGIIDNSPFSAVTANIWRISRQRAKRGY